jgi:hypothetical protein
MRICCGCLLVVGIVLVAPGHLLAQGGQLGSKESLLKEWDRTRALRDRLMDGEKPGKDAADAAQATANYFLYRFTHETEIPEKLHSDFSKLVNGLLERPNSRKYVDGYLVPALAKSIEEVLDRDVKLDRSVVIHASMTLPVMAKLMNKDKSDKIGEFLVKAIRDPKTNDVVKLYAFKALREMMPIAAQPSPLHFDPKNQDQNDRRARDKLYVEALTDYIDRPIDLTGLNYEEYAAKRYIRREAIITLAQAGSPAVLALPAKEFKMADAVAPVAPTLLRVLADPVPPNQPASIRSLILKEKVEAALGLCNMKFYKDAAKNTEMQEYDPAVANYLIALTLHEFASEYSKDLSKFIRAGAEKRLPYIAWKNDAKRFRNGLENYVGKREKENPKAAEIRALVDVSILPSMEKYLNVEGGKIGELERKVKDLRPAAESGKVFRTLPKAPVIKLPPAN